jgi:hypothetical protein
LQLVTTIVETTPCISEEKVTTYKDITLFRANMHHLYVQAKKDPAWQWFPTSYRLTTEDVNLIITDWEEEWKSPAEKTGPSEEEEDQDKSEEEQDQTNGAGNLPGQSTVPEAGLKRKDKGPEQAGGAWKKVKAQRKTPFYILTNDDMDRIGYQIWDTIEEIWEEATKKQENNKRRCRINWEYFNKY